MTENPDALAERTNAELATWQACYADWLKHEFTQQLMAFAFKKTAEAGQATINSLDPKRQAEYFAWEKMADGTCYRGAYYERVSSLKAPYLAAASAQTLEAQGARGASLGDRFSRDAAAPGEW